MGNDADSRGWYASSLQPISPRTGNCRHYFQLITEMAWLSTLGRARFRSSQMAMGTCQSFLRRIVDCNKIVDDRRSFSDFPATPSPIVSHCFLTRRFFFRPMSELPERVAAEWYTAMRSTGHQSDDSQSN